MFRFPQRHSRAPPPLHLPRGLSPVEVIFSFSQGGGGTELCCFNFGFYDSAFPNKIIHGYGVVLMAEPLCAVPLKNPAGMTGNEPHDKKETWILFLALEYM